MIKSSILILSLAFSVSATAAERTLRSHPVANAEIDITIEEIKSRINKPNLQVVQVVFASGTQEYQFINGEWKAKGPKADLFPVNQRSRLNAFTKSGTHFMDFSKPGWKFIVKEKPVEVIAQKAIKLPGGSKDDVPWLHVEAQQNDAGITDIFRIHTRAGIAPQSSSESYDGLRFGSSYETIYVALK